MKEALVEVLDDRRDVLYDILSEVMEDVALVHEIREGEATEMVSRKEIFDILEVRP
ncbi:MAG: hypothetical protein V1736_03570 [Pseudomonadota bacterium]